MFLGKGQGAPINIIYCVDGFHLFVDLICVMKENTLQCIAGLSKLQKARMSLSALLS